MSELSEFLSEEVYPQLDAVNAGLIDFFNPTSVNSSSRPYYSCDCPRCNTRQRAFYYPGNHSIVCNRRNECRPTSLWDAVKQSTNTSNKEVLELLCSAAGVKKPKGNKVSQHSVALAEIALKILRQQLHNNPVAIRYLTDRGYSKSDFESMPIGYYPSWKVIEQELIKNKADMSKAVEAGLIPSQEKRKTMKAWLMDGRITGLWKNPSLGFSVWGRKINEDQLGPKYFFSEGTIKDMPYGWSPKHIGFSWGVEGTLDSEALTLMGVKGCALGGATVNTNQAKFLCEKGVTEFGHIIDADKAGLKGGRDSVKRLEAVGITSYIVVIPDGLDDPDSMRRNGQTHEFHHLIQNSRTGGYFVAMMILSTLHKYPKESGRLMREAHQIRNILTPASRLEFERVFIQYGAPLQDEKNLAVNLYQQLSDLGFDEDFINKRIEKLYGVNLSISKKVNNNV